MASRTTNRLRSTWLRCTAQILHHSGYSFVEFSIIYYANRTWGRAAGKEQLMNFEYSAKVKDLEKRLRAFMDEHIYPNEARFYEEIEKNRWAPTRVIEELKP